METNETENVTENETENEDISEDERDDVDLENGETSEEEPEIVSEEEQTDGNKLDNIQRRSIGSKDPSTQPEGVSRRKRGTSKYNLRILNKS